MATVALVGAGGTMGCRITDNMKKQTEYRMLHVEVADAGRQRLAERGVTPVPAEEALVRDGALKMLREAQAKLFRPDWKKVFEPESVEAQLESILKPPSTRSTT